MMQALGSVLAQSSVSASEGGSGTTMSGISSASQLRDQCANILRGRGWRIRRDVRLAKSPKGGYITADIVATKLDTGRQVVICPRWQATSGTAEEKVPFLIIKMQIAILQKPDVAQCVYLVLEGGGWTWREFYLAGGLEPYINTPVPVRCMSLADLESAAEAQCL